MPSEVPLATQARVSHGGCDLLMFSPARGRRFSFFFFCGGVGWVFWFAFWSARHVTTGPREPPQLFCTGPRPGFRELPTSPPFGFQVPTRGKGQVQRVRLPDRSWKVPHIYVSGSPRGAPSPTWLHPIPGPAALSDLIPQHGNEL